MNPVQLQPYAGTEPPWIHTSAFREEEQRALPQGAGGGLQVRDSLPGASPGPAIASSGAEAYLAGDQPLPGQWVDLWA